MNDQAQLFDTGPLLCFAAIRTGPTMLKERYRPSGHTTAHVLAELRGLRKSRNGAIAKAASIAANQMGWLTTHTFDTDAITKSSTFYGSNFGPSRRDRHPVGNPMPENAV